jgi:hypothetical protein
MPPHTLLRPWDFTVWTGLDIPDPITFVTSPKWLDRAQIYPRQVTLLKVIFLREDLFTDYDYQVVGEWEDNFRRTGNNGIVPNILPRMRWLREMGYSWFREVLLVMGRRAGKGHISALAMAYVLWNYLAKSDPQKHYGVDRDKKLACFIYAGKKQQARENLWADLTNVILSGPCFTPYVSRPMGETLTVFAPGDFMKMRKRESRGIITAADQATFTIQPKEATMGSGRGPASFMQGYDEMAHQVSAGGAARSAEEIYGAATPALDQFKKDAFIVEPSSPWQMIGQFYMNWEKCLEFDGNGDPTYPEMMMIQLTSWDIYEDWQHAHTMDLFPPDFLGDLKEYETEPHPRMMRLKGAIQEYDDAMKRLERANPETFAVERLSHWQATIDAYLDPRKIDNVFAQWRGETLQMNREGILSVFYKGHADPSLANANFGVAIAHPEQGDDGFTHCVFDYISHWDPADFPDSTIDYVQVEDELWDLIKDFKPDEFTFDQWNSASVIAQLKRKVYNHRFPKRVQIYEQTATVGHNWKRAENFKVAINQGWVHAPFYELAALELRFLQLKNGKVEKQDTGPVTTKDVADCYDCQMEVLTEHGWKLFKDVDQGERVATRSPEGALEYQVPTEHIERHHTGVMYEYESPRLNFSVTPKHRMLVVDSEGRQRFVHAEDLSAKQYFVPKTALVSERAPNTISFDTDDLSASRLRHSREDAAGARQGWTPEQDAYLTQHYATTSMADLCAVLGKTRGAIYNRAKPSALNLKRGQIGDRIGDRPTPLPETKVEDFAAFLGIWLAEGRKMRNKRGYDVKITQTKPGGVEWIDNLCSRLPWPIRRSVQANGETVWVVKSYGLREYLRACQGEGHELHIPDEVFSTWTRGEMEALLEGLLVGDGVWSPQQQRFVGYYGTSKRLVDDVQRLIMHLGYSSGAAKIIQRKTQYQANHDLWYAGVNTSQRATLTTANLKQVDYDGPVYCLTVPNSTLLVRRNGVPMWSGNCMFECVWKILGDQVGAYMGGQLSQMPLGASAQGGFDAYSRQRDRPAAHEALGSLGRDFNARSGRYNAARSGTRAGRRR